MENHMMDLGNSGFHGNVSLSQPQQALPEIGNRGMCELWGTSVDRGSPSRPGGAARRKRHPGRGAPHHSALGWSLGSRISNCGRWMAKTVPASAKSCFLELWLCHQLWVCKVKQDSETSQSPPAVFCRRRQRSFCVMALLNALDSPISRLRGVKIHCIYTSAGYLKPNTLVRFMFLYLHLKH